MSSRVVVYEASCAEGRPSVASLADQGFELIDCADARSVLEQVVQGHVDALVFALCDDKGQDLGLLRLVRRAAPDLPLVLLARDDVLSVRRELQHYNPVFYADWPPDPVELREAVSAAVLKGARRPKASPSAERYRGHEGRTL